MGKITRLSTSNKRNESMFISFEGIIYESNSIFLKSEYSYLQYHWCPIVLMEIEGRLISSSKYKIRREGKAINKSTIAGRIVQIISIVCPWSKNRLFNLLKNSVPIKYPTNEVTKIKIRS